jgi:PAS domain S-box-containing protein
MDFSFPQILVLIVSLWLAWLVLKQAKTLPVPYARERIHIETYLKALLASPARMENFLWNSPLGVAYGDLKGRIADANDSFLGMLGYGRDDLQAAALTWHDLTPDPYHHLKAHTLEQMRTARLVKPLLKEYLRRDGSRVPVAAGGVVFPRSGKTVTLVLDLGAGEPAAARADLDTAGRSEA